MVDGCAGERPGLAVRPLFRHRLAPRRGGRGKGSAPHPRRPAGRRPGEAGAPAYPRRRGLCRPLQRVETASGPHVLPSHTGARPGGHHRAPGDRSPRARRAGALDGRIAAAAGPPRRPPGGGHQGAAMAPLPVSPWDQETHRRQYRCLQRPARKRRQSGPLTPAPGGPGLSARALEGGLRGAQLPSLLHHQRPRRPAGGGARCIRGLARPGPPDDRPGRGHRAAHRPRRWHVRPHGLPGAAPGPHLSAGGQR